MCASCALLAQFERCTREDSAEHYANLMLADEAVPPPWLRVNAIIQYRFGRDGLTQVKLAAQHIIEKCAHGKIQ